MNEDYSADNVTQLDINMIDAALTQLKNDGFEPTRVGVHMDEEVMVCPLVVEAVALIALAGVAAYRVYNSGIQTEAMNAAQLKALPHFESQFSLDQLIEARNQLQSRVDARQG